MTTLRDWARLDARWYEDPILLEAAEECASAFHLWPVLIGKAKHESHATDNPEGVFRITPRRLATSAWIPVKDVRPALDALTSSGLISFTEEGRNRLRIMLVGFGKWQTPRKSNAEAQARKRWLIERNRDSMRHGGVMDASCISHGSVMPDIDIDLDIERERDTSEKATPIADNALTKNIREVFDYWADATSTGRGRKPAFDAKRQARIRARLRDDKFTVTDLKACVDGFVASPWHNGTETGKRWLGIETIFRDAAQVEKGIELAVARSNASAASTTVGVDASVLYWIEKQIGRELSSAEDDALQRGSVSVDAFLAEHAPGVAQ